MYDLVYNSAYIGLKRLNSNVWNMVTMNVKRFVLHSTIGQSNTFHRHKLVNGKTAELLKMPSTPRQPFSPLIQSIENDAVIILMIRWQVHLLITTNPYTWTSTSYNDNSPNDSSLMNFCITWCIINRWNTDLSWGIIT